ncbi:lasso peptide biosynthesis PqqD family chaperone [Actinomadura sp. 9N215]|uniref:lasso peptide biosynthesis PqqD family chaperone n=1 Tax=Actinomadura sp. 9N215 TaxID=3375150 RepID=UPI0037975EAB
MYALAPNISTAETEYGAVLLDEEHGRYWNLNPTGVLVLKSILEDGDPRAAVGAVVKDFDVAEDVVREDVETILGRLVSAGILVSAPERGDAT